MNVNETIKLALQNYQSGNLNQAEYLFNEVIKNQPNNAEILYFLGIIYAQLEKYDLAIQHIKKSLQFAQDNANAYVALGGCLKIKGQYDEAISYYEQALELNPNQPNVYMDIGFMQKEKKQLDKAKLSYRKAVQIEPNLIIYDDIFVSMLKGVIHVGANIGQERELYAIYGLNVIWIEPFPEVFNKLKTFINPYPDQKAFCYLITDVDGKDYSFNISNNEGLSSSIYDLGGHKEFWPDVNYINNIALKSITLPSLIKKEHIELIKYDALVLDTQGSELLVLKGAVSILPHIKYVKAEVADFESYKGSCQLHDIDAFLKEHNFRRIAKERCAHKEGVGAYYEVLYMSNI